MSNRPYQVIRNIFKSQAGEGRELGKYLFEKVDSISLWIIGLSIGAIAALASKLTELNKLLTDGQIKSIFLLLFISVICGIFYRLIYLWLYVLVNWAYKQIEISLSNLDLVDMEFDLDGTEPFEELIRLNNQFQNLDYLLELYRQSPEAGKTILYKEMVELYRTETRIAKQEYNLALRTVEDAYKSALGIRMNLHNITAATSKKIVIRITRLRRVCVSLYLTFVITFLVAIGYFLFAICQKAG